MTKDEIPELPKSLIRRLERQLASETDYLWKKESTVFKLCRKYLRFYRNPWAMRMTMLEKRHCGWEKRERILKKLVPVQWFFRSTIPRYFRFKWFWIKHTYYDLRYGKINYEDYLK